MKKLMVLLSLLVSFACFSASFLPPNNMYISVDDKNAGGISEVQFNDVITKVEAVYKPVIAKLGKELVIQRNWKDGTVNAYASQRGNQWIVAMFGGLARSKEVTVEGFALVVCHEIGHHLGGAPLYNGYQWAAAEGQADYYSTLKCFRRAFKTETVTVTVPSIVTDKCNDVFVGEDEIKLCERSISGGLSLASLLADLGGDNVPTVETPDMTVVTKTNDSGYPGTQSRLDSYVAGALCDVSEDIDTVKNDPFIGTCKTGPGSRPLSWFKP